MRKSTDPSQIRDDIRRLEQEFNARKQSGRQMSRSVAAAYRISIQRKHNELHPTR